MIKKEDYIKLKKEIKCYCKKHITDLCDTVGLNDLEKNLVMYLYENKTTQKACMDFSISYITYNSTLKTALSKIWDYKNTL